MSTDSEWCQKTCARGDIEQTLAHINSSDVTQNMDEVTRCRSLFDALNTLWTAHRKATHTLEASDSKAISELLTTGIPELRREWLCKSAPVFQFATFKPQILNHNVLVRSPKYRLDQPIPPDLAHEATEKHRQLARAMDRWKNTSSNETQTALLKKFAQMLYVVRSNIAHGEKTPYGPDLQKAERDREVCAATRPALEVLFEALLGFPASRLAVYGSLAPGQTNHAILAGIQGTWENGFACGYLEQKDGLPSFRWKRGSGKVPVKLLTSPTLNKHWKRIDQFEGKRYRRILSPIDNAEGEIVVANIYEAR